MPKTLAERPFIEFPVSLYFDAYLDLIRRRQSSMTLLPLMVSEIYLYAKIFNFESDMQFFYRVICALDEAFITKHIDDMQTKRDQDMAKAEAAADKAKRARRGG